MNVLWVCRGMYVQLACITCANITKIYKPQRLQQELIYLVSCLTLFVGNLKPIQSATVWKSTKHFRFHYFKCVIEKVLMTQVLSTMLLTSVKLVCSILCK